MTFKGKGDDKMKNYFKNSYKRKNRQTYGANLFIATVTMAVILALFLKNLLLPVK